MRDLINKIKSTEIKETISLSTYILILRHIDFQGSYLLRMLKKEQCYTHFKKFVLRITQRDLSCKTRFLRVIYSIYFYSRISAYYQEYLYNAIINFESYSNYSFVIITMLIGVNENENLQCQSYKNYFLIKVVML